MPLMNWNAMLSVNIQSIDDQHKVLVGYVNEMYDAMMDGKGNDIMGGILNNLIDYTVKHFKFEEDIFAEHGYEHTTAHKAEHANLCDQVIAFKKEFDAGEVAVSADLMSFLKEWLLNHIMKSDKSYSAFLVSKGVK